MALCGSVFALALPQPHLCASQGVFGVSLGLGGFDFGQGSKGGSKTSRKTKINPQIALGSWWLQGFAGQGSVKLQELGWGIEVGLGILGVGISEFLVVFSPTQVLFSSLILQ